MNETAKVAGVTGSAVGLSALALAFGACCVAPWAVTLLGVGGAVLLARLAFAQPYVVGLTIGLIALGFWYVCRRLPATQDCPVEKRTRLRRLVWIGALVVIAIDVASFAPFFLA